MGVMPTAAAILRIVMASAPSLSSSAWATVMIRSAVEAAGMYTVYTSPCVNADPYSCLSASEGEMREARWAGTQAASIATPMRIDVTAMNVAGSVGRTSNRNFSRTRVTANAPAAPIRTCSAYTREVGRSSLL